MKKVLKPSGKILFREAQQFRQLWLWMLIIVSSIVPLVFAGVLLSQDKKVSAGQLLGILSLIGGISMINIILLYIVKFETIITDSGLYYRWIPFMKKYKEILWETIDTVTMKKYPYFQYGYHSRKGYGKVHNVDGKRGVQLVLTDGKQLYIGTQKQSAMQHSLEQVKPVAVETK